MKSSMGMAGVFGLFGASSTLATIVLFLLLPETKGKSLLQIEQYYQKSNILWQTRKKMAPVTASQRIWMFIIWTCFVINTHDGVKASDM